MKQRSWMGTFPWLWILISWTIHLATGEVLLFPEKTVFQFTVGASVPVASSKRGNVVFSSGFQFNYALPWNASQIEPIVLEGRSFEDSELQDVYLAIESALEEHGWRNGRECLLRTICELGSTPLDRSGEDVVEEIVHLLLTPSEDSPDAANSSRRSIKKLYREAELLGRSGGDCVLTYPNCAASPLESFTAIVFP
ncbi:uncharacterized protein LOC105701926 [Orussus abietinus]|uniref:uncharacterized protein LOC105701926 n=1 Tax=Orussus abietinus TaxID=222816 RepID=UPI000624F9C0|nr:uncharacterized protein LOC105701926 [Orussus abietinus]